MTTTLTSQVVSSEWGWSPPFGRTPPTVCLWDMIPHDARADVLNNERIGDKRMWTLYLEVEGEFCRYPLELPHLVGLYWKKKTRLPGSAFLFKPNSILRVGRTATRPYALASSLHVSFSCSVPGQVHVRLMMVSTGPGLLWDEKHAVGCHAHLPIIDRLIADNEEAWYAKFAGEE